MARYALAEHVFVCVNGEHLVFLDLRKDRYWALEAAMTAGLARVVGGWPVTAPESDEQSVAGETTAVIEVLKGRGLLTETASPGKDASPVTSQLPISDLVSEPEMGAKPHERAWLAFLTACVVAKLTLRFWPFERVVARVRRRKARCATAPTDLRSLRSLVEAFMRYRVFLFSSKDECLYDSLALLDFLARYGFHPDWVFGVQTRPFGAHCWVQCGAVVCNDTVEHVTGFTPIMVV